MGVSICWRPVSSQTHDITPGARSDFYDALSINFGEFPIKLDESHVRELNAMSCAVNDKSSKESYQALIEAIGQHKEIEVEARW